MANIIFSEGSGVNDVFFGKYDAPIRAMIMDYAPSTRTYTRVASANVYIILSRARYTMCTLTLSSVLQTL